MASKKLLQLRLNHVRATEINRIVPPRQGPDRELCHSDPRPHTLGMLVRGKSSNGEQRLGLVSCTCPLALRVLQFHQYLGRLFGDLAYIVCMLAGLKSFSEPPKTSFALSLAYGRVEEVQARRNLEGRGSDPLLLVGS